MYKSIINEQCSRRLRQCNDGRKETGDINIMEKTTYYYLLLGKQMGVFYLKYHIP